MTIEFLDTLNEAHVTKGFWRWRRRATVILVTERHIEPGFGTHEVWRYFISERNVEDGLDAKLRASAEREAKRQQREMDWLPVRTIPQARRLR